MIFHILPDDKYVNTFCNNARSVSDIDQTFIVRDSKPYKYLPETADYLIDAPINTPSFDKILASAGKGDRIIIHFLHPTVRRWLANFNTSATIEWVFWSSDFYYFMYGNYPDYDEETYKYVHRDQQIPLSRFKLLHTYRKWKNDKRLTYHKNKFLKERDACISKISVFHHYIQEEYTLVKRLIPMHAQFNYFFYEQDLSYDEIYRQSSLVSTVNSPVDTNSLNLLVGNCGYPYINHLDSFNFLKGKITTCQLVLPLSYGEQPYIEHVVSRGKAMFGNSFHPVFEYLTFESYLALLKSCQGMILHLNTAKAMGNILTLLLMGKRVFIKKEMLAYAFLTRLGIEINTIEDFSEELLAEPLDSDVINKNISIILEIFSAENSQLAVERMLKLAPVSA